jgi:hypothetical protein
MKNNEGAIKFIVGFVIYIITFYFRGKYRGWNKVSKLYILDKDKGKVLRRIRDCRLRVNDFSYFGRYKKAININVYEKGIEIQKVLPLQMKNFAIFLRWDDILHSKKRRFLGMSSLIISLKDNYMMFDRKSEVEILDKYIKDHKVN